MTHRLYGVDLALVGLYLALMLWLAWRRGQRRKDGAEDYLLAGRSLTLPAFVATLVSTWYGGVLGVGEYSYEHGLSNWLALGGPYYLAGLLFAFFLARRARESLLVTVPERLLRDHGPAVGTIGAALVFVNMLPAAYLLMLGVLARRTLGVGLVTGIILSALFCYACVVGGGFRSVVRNNLLQFVLMYGAFFVVLPFALWKAGGPGAFARLPAEHLSWDGGLGWQAIVLWYVIALQTLVEPSFYQRCYAARSPRVARRGIICSVAFWIVFDALTTVTGMLARVLVPQLEEPIDAYPALADTVLPSFLRGLFYVGLIATVMSTVESYLFVAATTLGFDLPLAWRRWRGRQQEMLPEAQTTRRTTRWGLALATVASLVLALTTHSVIALWKAIASIITPALLLPLLGGFVPRWRVSSQLTLASMLLSSAVAIAWMAPTWFGAALPLGVEAIFPALGVSVLCHLPALWRGRTV